MSYLLGELFWYLSAAFIIGMLVGIYMHKVTASNAISSLKTSIANLEAELENCMAQHAGKAAESSEDTVRSQPATPD